MWNYNFEFLLRYFLSNLDIQKWVKFGIFSRRFPCETMELDLEAYQGYFQVCVKFGPRGHIFRPFSPRIGPKWGQKSVLRPNLSTVDSPHKGQSRGALMFSLICAWRKACAKNWDARDLRRHCAHYDVTVTEDYPNKYDLWALCNAFVHLDPSYFILILCIIHSSKQFNSTAPE